MIDRCGFSGPWKAWTLRAYKSVKAAEMCFNILWPCLQRLTGYKRKTWQSIILFYSKYNIVISIQYCTRSTYGVHDYLSWVSRQALLRLLSDKSMSKKDVTHAKWQANNSKWFHCHFVRVPRQHKEIGISLWNSSNVFYFF